MSSAVLPQLRLSVLALIVAPLFAQGCALTSAPPMTASDPSNTSLLAPQAQDTTVESAISKDAPKKPVPKPVGIGKASWYGPGLRGKKTANGDIFDDSKFTAAHKSLPLGSRAKVTNLSNGKSVEVEINDRGPFVEDRVIDLSQAAAHALGMVDRGVANVRVDLMSD